MKHHRVRNVSLILALAALPATISVFVLKSPWPDRRTLGPYLFVLGWILFPYLATAAATVWASGRGSTVDDLVLFVGSITIAGIGFGMACRLFYLPSGNPGLQLGFVQTAYWQITVLAVAGMIIRVRRDHLATRR